MEATSPNEKAKKKLPFNPDNMNKYSMASKLSNSPRQNDDSPMKQTIESLKQTSKDFRGKRGSGDFSQQGRLDANSLLYCSQVIDDNDSLGVSSKILTSKEEEFLSKFLGRTVDKGPANKRNSLGPAFTVVDKIKSGRMNHL